MWKRVQTDEDGEPCTPYYEIRGKECTICLEPRPGYCDRGNWIAKVFPDSPSELARSLDEADGWPRYYFDEERARLEVEAWLMKRGQWIDVVHVLLAGYPLCGFSRGVPSTWPRGHKWARLDTELEHANCEACKTAAAARKEEMRR